MGMTIQALKNHYSRTNRQSVVLSMYLPAIATLQRRFHTEDVRWSVGESLNLTLVIRSDNESSYPCWRGTRELLDREIPFLEVTRYRRAFSRRSGIRDPVDIAIGWSVLSCR